MKKHLYVFCVLLAGILFSCSKNELGNNESCLSVTSFNVSVDGSLGTKAEGQEPSRYIMEIYKGAEATGTPQEHREQATGTFDNVMISNGQAYTVLFWADYGTPTPKDGSPAVSNDYDAADLKAVRVVAGKLPSNAAFAGANKFTVGKDDETLYTKVTLTHAVAQVRFQQTEKLFSASNTLVVTYPESYSLNLDKMSVTKIAGEITHSFTYNSQEPGILGTSYIIVNSESQTVMDITTALNAETARSITNVPFQRNHRTNIKGVYNAAHSTTMIIDCDKEWIQPDIEKPVKTGIKVSATQGANGAPVYEIYTAAGLKAFADIVNGAGTAYEIDGIKIPATSNKAQRKSNAILKEDISLSEICSAEKGNWKVIGENYYNSYTGTFDGNGRTIRNLYINDQKDRTSETGRLDVCYGLFGYAESTTIKDLTMEGSIVINNTGNQHSIRIGGICGGGSELVIMNCHSSVSINIKLENISSDGGGINAGGIIGDIGGGAIEQSTSSSDVRVEFNAPDSNNGLDCNAGGIVAYSYETDIINCHHDSGTVSACSNNYWCYVGGISGSTRYGEVFGCFNIAPVQGKSSTGRTQIGGISGALEVVKLAACYNTGEITISGETIEYNVGGMSGQCYSADCIGCYSTGNIIDNAPGVPSPCKGSLVGNFRCDMTPLPFLSQCWFIGTSGNGIGKIYGLTTNTDGGFVAAATDINSKVAGMNTAIKTYNDAAEADKKCLFHFVDGDTKSPIVKAGAPN